MCYIYFFIIKYIKEFQFAVGKDGSKDLFVFKIINQF